MKTKLLAVLCVLIACCLGLVMPQQAWAVETTTFTGAVDDEWDTSGNWDNGIPQDGDTAIIDTGEACNLDLATEDLAKLEVKSTANLNVKAGGNVRLTSGTNPSIVAGTITLESSTSKIEVTETLEINGAGKIVGTDNNAEIAVSSQKILTNSTTIEGKLKITGSAGSTKFVNHGVLRANAAGTLWVNTYDVDDLKDESVDPLWEISGSSSAVLRFDPAISGNVNVRFLDGDFQVAAGTLDVDFPGLSTEGTLTWTAGTIDCATSGGRATFKGS